MAMPLAAQGSHHRHKTLKHSANKPVRNIMSRGDRLWLKRVPMVAAMAVAFSYFGGLPGTTELALALMAGMALVLSVRMSRHTGRRHRRTGVRRATEAAEQGVLHGEVLDVQHIQDVQDDVPEYGLPTATLPDGALSVITQEFQTQET